MVRRFISNLIVLGCLGGSAYVVYRFVERSEQRKEYNSNVFIALLERFEVPFPIHSAVLHIYEGLCYCPAILSAPCASTGRSHIL